MKLQKFNKSKSRIADYWKKNKENNTVICQLSPRNCELKEGQMGFCGVRGNKGGSLHTYNYGIGVEATVETIETEAVYHFEPGSRILSLGNVGCMMACKFCQNWTTSQVEHLNSSNLRFFTPESVVEMAVKNNIDILSWTYNDPVVWQEFVLDTSRLAKKAGIKIVYKTALYIEPEPLEDLIEVVDVFSVSLKSMNSKMYRKFTKGELQPVLNGILQIAKSNCHLEISQLIVTELNDQSVDAQKTARWILEEIGNHVPLHFVGYHPAYVYNKPRTSLSVLIKAREIAKKEGILHCYLGNIYRDDVSNTQCTQCGNLLIQRFGLTIVNKGLDAKNNCAKCGQKSPIKGNLKAVENSLQPKGIHFKFKEKIDWNTEQNSLHIIQTEGEKCYIKVVRKPQNKTEYYELNAGIERLILSKSTQKENQISIYTEKIESIVIVPVLDRAHFPVLNKSEHSENYIN